MFYIQSLETYFLKFYHVFAKKIELHKHGTIAGKLLVQESLNFTLLQQTFFFWFTQPKIHAIVFLLRKGMIDCSSKKSYWRILWIFIWSFWGNFKICFWSRYCMLVSIDFDITFTLLKRLLSAHPPYTGNIVIISIYVCYNTMVSFKVLPSIENWQPVATISNNHLQNSAV
jgi:hypothetical protein